MKKNIHKLQKKLYLKFKNYELLERSVTHKSFNPNLNNEKLEFLGDRVLGLTISKKLIDLYPDEKEGSLDKKLASLVNKNKCYEVGKFLSLEKFILIGNSKKSVDIEKKIIADCCEALIGAVYLEKGFEFAQKFILRLWKKYIDLSNITIVDSKTKLQEYSLKHFKILPIYKIISTSGPKHKLNFRVAVKLKNTKFFEATGSSKKNAEQEAAKNFLKNFNL